MVFVRDPEHAVFDGTVFDARGRASAAGAAFGDDSKFFRFLLPGGGNAHRARFVLQFVGHHPRLSPAEHGQHYPHAFWGQLHSDSRKAATLMFPPPKRLGTVDRFDSRSSESAAFCAIPAVIVPSPSDRKHPSVCALGPRVDPTGSQVASSCCGRCQTVCARILVDCQSRQDVVDIAGDAGINLDGASPAFPAVVRAHEENVGM